jgi:hypothetical protein
MNPNSKSGGAGAEKGEEGEIVEIKQQIIVLKQHIEESQTMIMTRQTRS